MLYIFCLRMKTKDLKKNVISSLTHFFFRSSCRPSTSEDENISIDFYAAELIGIIGKCNEFDRFCPNSLLDIISVLKQ